RAYQQAIRNEEQLEKLFPRVPEYQHKLAHFYHNLGHLVRDRDGREPAGKLYAKAQELEEQLVARHPGSAAYRSGLALALHNHGQMKATTNLDEAIRMSRRAAKILAEVRGDPQHRSVPSYAHDLAEIEHNLPKLLLAAARRADSQHRPA